MIYKSYSPSPALVGFVRNYTIIHFRFNQQKPVPPKERAAKAEEKIVFYIRGSVSRFNPANGTTQAPPPVSIYSHQTGKSTFQVTPEFHALIVFLKPGMLHRLIGLPMFEIQREILDAELFFGTEVSTVNERLAEASGYPGMVSIVEQFLISRFKSLAKNSIDVVADRLLTDPTSFTVDDIASEACLSTRQFRRKFTEQIGISPKFFSRLARFNHSYRYKITNPNTSWSSIAQQFQYTDYHHLEKEFREFSGLTPERWVTTHLTAPERILRLR